MAEKLSEWLEKFAANGADPTHIDNWPETYEGKEAQTDWNQQDDSAPDFLKNKPDINNIVETKINSEVLNLIKTDEDGNVFINKGFEYVYTLAEEFDENETYYEAYVPDPDTTKLTGTWLQKQTTKPSNMYSFSKSFTEGTVMASGTYHPTTDTPFSEYILSISSSGNVYFKRFGASSSTYGPMFIGNDWNCAGDLSFKSEVDAATLAFVQQFYIKKTDRVTDETGNCTTDMLMALDRANPNYRQIVLTPETFVADTYYTLTKTPMWVNVKDLLN